MISLEETSDGVFLEERVLQENSQYFFYVKVYNDVGAIESIPVQICKYDPFMNELTMNIIVFIVTTDVQEVNFTIIVGDTYSIQCGYLNGSNVSGCVYILVSRVEGVENVTGFIERDSDGVTLEVANIGCYSEVLAYENTTNEIIPVRTNIITSEVCPITVGKQLPLKARNLFNFFPPI